MIKEKHYLVSRNARDKVQVKIFELNQDGTNFFINRWSGQHMGKMTMQPTLTIEKGKAKRSILQQAELEFNSLVKKDLDKGYKKLTDLTDDNFEDLDLFDMDKLVPSIKSDQSGNYKPMLAKDHNKCQNSVLNKPMYASRKLNGVRCMMKWDGEKVVTISRGGKNYDGACEKITSNETLIKILKGNPNLILDGELYKHGVALQTISGIARLDNYEDRCDILEYHIYDIASDTLTFEKRLEYLESLADIFEGNEKIFILEHVFTESWNEIKSLHDKWVKEGYEGAVCRKPDKVYGFGKRGSDMIKVKAYKEDSFTINDYVDGLRDEDFCFIMETIEGKTFKAKPIGTREQKAEYIDNIDDIIGRKGDCKFFEMSNDNIPLQAIFLHVRYDI